MIKQLQKLVRGAIIFFLTAADIDYIMILGKTSSYNPPPQQWLREIMMLILESVATTCGLDAVWSLLVVIKG